MGIELHDAALYSIAILLALYNLIVLLLLNHFAKRGNEVSHVAVKKIINVQITDIKRIMSKLRGQAQRLSVVVAVDDAISAIRVTEQC